MQEETLQNVSSFCCCLQPKSAADFEQTTPQGLVMGHAYGITGVNHIDTASILGELRKQLFLESDTTHC